MFAKHLNKFHEINAMSESVFGRRCAHYSNCTICPIAMHVDDGSHRCTYGMSEMEFSCIMATAECSY